MGILFPTDSPTLLELKITAGQYAGLISASLSPTTTPGTSSISGSGLADRSHTIIWARKYHWLFPGGRKILRYLTGEHPRTEQTGKGGALPEGGSRLCQRRYCFNSTDGRKVGRVDLDQRWPMLVGPRLMGQNSELSEGGNFHRQHSLSPHWDACMIHLEAGVVEGGAVHFVWEPSGAWLGLLESCWEALQGVPLNPLEATCRGALSSPPGSHLRLSAGLSSWVYSGPVKHLGNQEEGRHLELGFWIGSTEAISSQIKENKW